MFERLPAWVSARACELTPLAVLAPHATLRRLVMDGLWHTTQARLLDLLEPCPEWRPVRHVSTAMMSWLYARPLLFI